MSTDRFDEVLHQPTRVRIMTYLFLNRQTALATLRGDLGLTAGNLATHLARLAAAGYVESRRVLSGVFEVRIFLTQAGAQAFQAYIGSLEEFVRRVKDQR